MSQTPAPTFDELRAEALALRAERRHAEALARFGEALAVRPADRWTRNDMALEHLALGETGAAEALARALADDAPNFAPAHRTLGLVARAEGRPDAALAGFREAARRDPRDLWNRYDEGVALRALGRGEEAASTWTRLASGTPLPHALRGLADGARERGAGEEAYALLRSASLLLPDDPWFALDAARQGAALGREAEAETALDALLARRPGFAPAALERARLARTPGRIASALAALRRAQADAPHDEALICAEADLLRRAGDTLEAETVLARFLARAPASPAILRALARAARERGDGEAAAAHLKAALALSPADPMLRLERAAALRDAGALALAEAELAAFANEPSPPVEALLDLYRLRQRRIGPGTARPLLARALALGSAHPGALLLHGDDLRLQGDLAGASAAYEGALAAQPRFYWALIGLAAVARAEGRGEDALRALDRATEIDPMEAHAQIEAAALLREAGALNAARQWLARIPIGARRAAEAGLAEALIRRADGRWAEAAETFETVAQRHGERRDALVDAAEDWMRVGDTARAETCLDRLRLAEPEHPALWEADARRALVQDDPATACDLFDRAAARDPARLSAWLGAARAMALTGDVSGALERLAAIRVRFGERPEEASLRADLLRQTGRLGEARDVLDEARARHPHHAHLWQQAQVERIDSGAHEAVDADLAAPPAGLLPEEGRRHFVGSLLASARWDFGTAIREGEAATARLPGDGWVRNRLIHAALLGLDMERAGAHLSELAALEAGASRLKGKSANPSQNHYGQLYDEFRMDAEAVAALRRALMSADPAARLAALRACVETFPDNTLAALQFLIELRRQGAAPMASDVTEREGPSAIPRVIHQFWDASPPPPDIAAYGASWQSENAGFAYRLWSRASAGDYLSERGLHAARAAFERAREPAMKADLFRLALLAEDGGVYADADDRCLAPIHPLLCGPVGLVTYQEDLGSLGNNILGAVPGHPVITLARDLAVNAVNRGDNDILWLSTGPGLLSRAAARILATRPEDARDLLVIDRHTLARFAAIHCLAGYKSTERHWSRTAFARAGRSAKRG